jgi:hypothetical protein
MTEDDHRERPLARIYDDQLGLPSPDALVPEDGYDTSSVPFRTKPNIFGIYRIYPFGYPSYTPDSLLTLAAAADGPNLQSQVPVFRERLNMGPAEIFDNPSVEALMKWFIGHQSILLSKAQVTNLVNNVILHPDFDPEHFRGFNLDRELARIDNLVNDPHSYLPIQDNWKSSPVSIAVPVPGKGASSVETSPKFTTKVHHRDLLDLIKSAFSEPDSEYFHLHPFEEYWQLPDGPDERLYSELYTSGAYISINSKVEALGCEHEPVIAALMLYSDGTCLTRFGATTLYPFYVFFGNLSKYTRGKPSSFSAHHLAYPPTVSCSCFCLFLFLC